MTKAHSLRTLVILVSCLLLASGAFAAEMVNFGDKAAWNVDAAHGGDLTVVGPSGFSMQKFAGANETFEFSLYDKAGFALPDGQYSWHLTLAAAKSERGDAPVGKAASYSGSFRIESGSLVIPQKFGVGDTDGISNKDQVIADDLIVDGSACVGQDCVNGENFGFDTIRLKENNLRIKFDDTSSSGSFPNVDWQLFANESDNGGANRFSIDDITNGKTPFTIEAAAPSHSLYVDSDGRVGIGTSAPVVEGHIKDGDTPTLRLEQDGSSGFTPQTWDLAGNEANFFVRDVTNGSKLSFRIRPGAPESSIDIAASGDVGIGTSSPGSELHVRRTDAGGTRIEVQNGNAAAQNTSMRMTNATRTWDVRNNTAGDFAITNVTNSSIDLVVNGGTGDVTVRTLSGNGASSAVCVDNDGKLIIC